MTDLNGRRLVRDEIETFGIYFPCNGSRDKGYRRIELTGGFLFLSEKPALVQTLSKSDRIRLFYKLTPAGTVMTGKNLFTWKQFQPDIILLCMRWYLRYSLTYRDLVEMMAERGLAMALTTIMRWVLQYAPELDKRTRKHLKLTGDSWKVDETYVKR